MLAGIIAVLSFVVVGLVTTAWLLPSVLRRASLGGKLLASVVTVLIAWGAAQTLAGLVKLFGAVGGESVDPSQTGRILVVETSEVMSYSALVFVVWVPAAIAALMFIRKPSAGAGSGDR